MGPMPAAVGMAFMEEAEEYAEDSSARNVGKEHRPYESYKSRRQRKPIPTASQPAQPAQQPSSRDRSNTASSSISSSTASSRRQSPSRQSSISSTETAFQGKEAVATAHQNLRTRLSPFWSSILPNRRVLFDVHAVPVNAGESHNDNELQGAEGEQEEQEIPKGDPIYSFELLTDSNGHFSRIITIPWETLCTTPSTVAAVFDSRSSSAPLQGWKLKVRARLDYEALPVVETDGSYRDRLRRAVSTYGRDAVDRVSTPSTPTGEVIDSTSKLSLNSPDEPQVVEWTDIKIGSARGVHVISDLVRTYIELY